MTKQLLPHEALERAQALAHVGTWMIDPRTMRLTWSDETYRLYGWDPETTEVNLPMVMARIHPDDRRSVEEAIASMVSGASGETRWAHRIVDLAGNVRWLEYSGGLGPDGMVVGFLTDCTEREEDRLRLQAEMARSDLALSIARMGSWMLDTNEGTVSWSPHVYELLDIDPGSFKLTFPAAFSVVDPAAREAAERYLGAILRGESPGMFELHVVHRDGSVHWFELRASLVREGCVVGVLQDVTERRARDQQLRFQEQMLETMTGGVLLIRPSDAKILWANRRAASQLGLTEEDIVGRYATEFIAPDGGELRADIEAGLRRDGIWSGPLERRRVDGLAFWTEARFTPMDHPDHGPVWLCVTFDITDRIERERALHESQAHLQAVQDAAPTGVATVGMDRRWLYVNDTLCTVLGRSREELAGLTFDDVAHPGDPGPGQDGAADILAGRTETALCERRFVRPGGELVWTLTSVSLVHDSDGEPKFFVVHVLDITERKAEEQLRRRQALELERANQAKSELLSRMSHELRTPLNAVLGFGQLLEQADLQPDDRSSVTQILTAGRHLLELIDDVLDITEVESGTLDLRVEPVDIGGVLREIAELVSPTAVDHSVTLSLDAPTSGPLALGDRRRIVQVLVHLVANAIKYNRRDGVVRISTDPAPGTVCIAVADSGPGIADDEIGRVFEPFDRLGREGEDADSAGIGLSLARSLAEQMQGRITVESMAGVGSTFTLELPAAPAPEVPHGAGDGHEAAGAAGDDHRLTVVNIEDNPANQRLVKAIMRQRANVVLRTADCGVKGLDLVRTHRPGLVLLDLHLPDMPGTEVLRRIRADPAGSPVVAVCSADASPTQVEALLAQGADHYLTKPFTIPALLDIVDRTAASVREPAH